MILRNKITFQIQEVLLLSGGIDQIQKIRIAFPELFPSRSKCPIIFGERYALNDYIIGLDKFSQRKTYVFFMGHTPLTLQDVNDIKQKLSKIGVSQCDYSDISFFHNIYIENGATASKECTCDSHDLLWRGHIKISCPFYKNPINKDP